jgi:hypothetical protein
MKLWYPNEAMITTNDHSGVSKQGHERSNRSMDVTLIMHTACTMGAQASCARRSIGQSRSQVRTAGARVHFPIWTSERGFRLNSCHIIPGVFEELYVCSILQIAPCRCMRLPISGNGWMGSSAFRGVQACMGPKDEIDHTICTPYLDIYICDN